MEALAREAFSAYNERDASPERARLFSTPDAIVIAVSMNERVQLENGYGPVFALLDAVWESNQVEFEAAEQLGELLLVRARVRGVIQGTEMEQPYWYLMDFAAPDGDLRISRMRIFADRDEAVRAAVWV